MFCGQHDLSEIFSDPHCQDMGPDEDLEIHFLFSVFFVFFVFGFECIVPTVEQYIMTWNGSRPSSSGKRGVGHNRIKKTTRNLLWKATE